MALTYKILGQSQLGTTAAAVYTVPSATQAVVSTLTVSNVSSYMATIDLYVVLSGGSASTANAVLYQAQVPPNSESNLTIGITLGAGDAIWATASASSTINVNIFGSEIS